MKRIFLCLIVVLFLIFGCTNPSEVARTPEPTPAPSTEFTTLIERESIVEVRAQGTVILYQRQSFWDEDELSTILQDKDSFSSCVVDEFADDLSKYGKQATDTKIEFNEEAKSMILRCEIHGAITKKDNSYYAVFSWLLEPLGLDFIDSDFEESEKGLFWKGHTNGVPTTLGVELPTINCAVYKAWQHPVGHCYAHAWCELPQ
jgi:hypothetical protein